MTIHNDKLTKREELVHEVVSGYSPSIDISKTCAPPAYIRRLAGEENIK